jgi:hypothetical protein
LRGGAAISRKPRSTRPSRVVNETASPPGTGAPTSRYGVPAARCHSQNANGSKIELHTASSGSSSGSATPTAPLAAATTVSKLASAAAIARSTEHLRLLNALQGICAYEVALAIGLA